MRFTLPVIGALAALSFSAPLLAQDAQARLWDAAIAGDTLEIRKAIDDGARIDSLDTRGNPNGRRALNWAAWHDRVAAIDLLLALGAPLEAENNTGFSALHHAAESGSVAAARVLLAAGADPSHANKAGRRPADTAREQGHLEIVSMLEAAEREPQTPQQ